MSKTRKTLPDRMEWRRERYVIWLDEDGLHMRIGSQSFEQPEVLAMIADYQAVSKVRVTDGAFMCPFSPTREEVLEWSYDQQEKRARREAIRAIERLSEPIATDAAF